MQCKSGLADVCKLTLRRSAVGILYGALKQGNPGFKIHYVLLSEKLLQTPTAVFSKFSKLLLSPTMPFNINFLNYFLTHAQSVDNNLKFREPLKYLEIRKSSQKNLIFERNVSNPKIRQSTKI